MHESREHIGPWEYGNAWWGNDLIQVRFFRGEQCPDPGCDDEEFAEWLSEFLGFTVVVDGYYVYAA